MGFNFVTMGCFPQLCIDSMPQPSWLTWTRNLVDIPLKCVQTDGQRTLSRAAHLLTHRAVLLCLGCSAELSTEVETRFCGVGSSEHRLSYAGLVPGRAVWWVLCGAVVAAA